MLRKKQKPILADKIAEVLAPRRSKVAHSDSEDETAAKIFEHDSGSEFEDEPEIPTMSGIRKQNARLLDEMDEKYGAKVVTRKKTDSDSDKKESEDEDDSEDEAAIEAFSKKLKTPTAESDEEDDIDSDDEESGNLETWGDDYEGEEIDEEEEEEEDEGEDGEDEEEDGEEEQESDEDESDFDGGDMVPKDDDEETVPKPNYDTILPKKQNDDQTQKGACVQNQIQIWEKLLEIRIHSQKMLIKANSLPTYNKFHRLTDGNSEFADLANKTEQNVHNLMSKMRELQSVLLRQYPETKNLAIKRKSSSADKNVPEAKRERIAQELDEDFSVFKDYQYGVISKWHDRTKVLTPGSIKTQKQQGNIDVVRKIEGVLANKADLIKKSQLLKGGYTLFDQSHTTHEPKSNRTLDENETNEKGPDDDDDGDDVYCTEVYDDTDFYHTQLRELIEYKTNSSGNATEMAKQFTELQKIRKKMKKTVDTRASKGRKIRYVVHNKLVSFMAPNESSEWDDEQKSDLFRSLFGGQS